MPRFVAFSLLCFGLPAVALAGAHQGADQGADVGADLAKSASCQECHGTDGIDLSGSDPNSLIAAMKKIRAGDSAHPPVLKGVSDADLAELAKILSQPD